MKDYLEHGHKYISRKFVNGKWVYEYDKQGGEKKPGLFDSITDRLRGEAKKQAHKTAGEKASRFLDSNTERLRNVAAQQIKEKKSSDRKAAVDKFLDNVGSSFNKAANGLVNGVKQKKQDNVLKKALERRDENIKGLKSDAKKAKDNVQKEISNKQEQLRETAQKASKRYNSQNANGRNSSTPSKKSQSQHASGRNKTKNSVAEKNYNKKLFNKTADLQERLNKRRGR